MLLTGLCCLSPNYEHIWLTQNQFMCRNQTIKKVSFLKPGHPFMQMKHCDLHGMAMNKQSCTFSDTCTSMCSFSCKEVPAGLSLGMLLLIFFFFCGIGEAWRPSLGYNYDTHVNPRDKETKDTVIYPCESSFWYPWSQVFSTPKSCTSAHLQILTHGHTLRSHYDHRIVRREISTYSYKAYHILHFTCTITFNPHCRLWT